MNYKGIFGFYNPIKRTGEIYDGRNSKPGAGLPCFVISGPILKLSDITHGEFETKLQSAIRKAEGETKE